MKKKKRDPRITSKIMSCIPSKGTRPEITLGKELWKNGLRYRKHYKIAGRPDFVLVSKKIAIFVDGDFWHGNNWRLRGLKSLSAELSSYKKFWRDKIKNNIQRDNKANKELRKNGWHTLRFWESDLKKKPAKIVKKILKAYGTRNPSL